MSKDLTKKEITITGEGSHKFQEKTQNKFCIGGLRRPFNYDYPKLYSVENPKTVEQEKNMKTIIKCI